MMQVQNFDMIEILSCDIFVIFAVFSLSSWYTAAGVNYKIKE
jgi:hypothetical protein